MLKKKHTPWFCDAVNTSKCLPLPPNEAKGLLKANLKAHKKDFKNNLKAHGICPEAGRSFAMFCLAFNMAPFKHIVAFSRCKVMVRSVGVQQSPQTQCGQL